MLKWLSQETISKPSVSHFIEIQLYYCLIVLFLWFQSNRPCVKLQRICQAVQLSKEFSDESRQEVWSLVITIENNEFYHINRSEALDFRPRRWKTVMKTCKYSKVTGRWKTWMKVKPVLLLWEKYCNRLVTFWSGIGVKQLLQNNFSFIFMLYLW